MSTPKHRNEPAIPYTVKYSNKTGGAYADVKAVIESERRTWSRQDRTNNSHANGHSNNSDKK